MFVDATVRVCACVQRFTVLPVHILSCAASDVIKQKREKTGTSEPQAAYATSAAPRVPERVGVQP